MRLGLSTSSLRLLSLEEKFALTKEIGYDGIEIMITPSREAHSYERLAELSKQYELPILAIHAPTLVATQFVWGVKPYPKLNRAAIHAAEVGADTVVVHPPFRWQASYSDLFFEAVSKMNRTHGVHIAVENMYPWYIGKARVAAYGVTWQNTVETVDSLTFDYSHATVAGIDIVSETSRILPNLRHVHLSDARVGSKVDSHLVPGRGNLPLREALGLLKAANWQGSVAAEVNTIRESTKQKRLTALRETYDRGREYMS